MLLAWGRSHRTTSRRRAHPLGDRPGPGRGLDRTRHGRGRARAGRRGRDRRAQADPGQRPGPAGDRPGRAAAGRPLRARGDAAHRRLAVAPAGGPRPARASSARRPTPTPSRRTAGRSSSATACCGRSARTARPRRAALLGRRVPRCRRGDRGRAPAAARRRSPSRWRRPTPRSPRRRPPPARLTLRYVTNAPPLPGEAPRDALARRLAETAEKEVWNGSTLVGPHRDDLVFELDGRDLAAFASRGQQRTAILALKLAELDVSRHSTAARRCSCSTTSSPSSTRTAARTWSGASPRCPRRS